jgi:hypothetical protein
MTNNVFNGHRYRDRHIDSFVCIRYEQCYCVTLFRIIVLCKFIVSVRFCLFIKFVYVVLQHIQILSIITSGYRDFNLLRALPVVKCHLTAA